MLAFDLTFKAFDPSAITQVQHAVQLLVKQVQISGGGDKICIVGLPTTKKAFTVLRSPHVHKKSREQFQTKIHKRLVDILNSTPKTVESLMKLDLPAGVDIEIKV